MSNLKRLKSKKSQKRVQNKAGETILLKFCESWKKKKKLKTFVQELKIES